MAKVVQVKLVLSEEVRDKLLAEAKKRTLPLGTYIRLVLVGVLEASVDKQEVETVDAE